MGAIYGYCVWPQVMEYSPSRAAVNGPLVADIPLAMEVVRHVNDVVDDLGHCGNGEVAQVPVRRGGGDRHRLAGPQAILDEQQELLVVNAVLRGALVWVLVNVVGAR